MDRIDSPEHAQPPHPLVGTTVGPYEILESIGVGAIGMVLKARLVNTEEFVALKLLPFDIDSTTIKRLEREAKVLSQLQHPNIVQVFDVRSTPTKQHSLLLSISTERISRRSSSVM
jgi:Protein kinase domain.